MSCLLRQLKQFNNLHVSCILWDVKRAILFCLVDATSKMDFWGEHKENWLNYNDRKLCFERVISAKQKMPTHNSKIV